MRVMRVMRVMRLLRLLRRRPACSSALAVQRFTLAAVALLHGAALRHLLSQRCTLLRGQHSSNVQPELQHAPADLVVLRQALLAQRLSRAGVDVGLRKQGLLLLAQAAHRCAPGLQIGLGGIDDLLDGAALLWRGVDGLQHALQLATGLSPARVPGVHASTTLVCAVATWRGQRRLGGQQAQAQREAGCQGTCAMQQAAARTCTLGLEEV